MDFDKQMDILTDLCAGAPSQDVRQCLQVYNPANIYTKLKKAFKRLSPNAILDTLVYLKRPGANALSTKVQLVEYLLSRIQSLFPEVCPDCDEEYCIGLDDKPLMSCIFCGQGAHDSCAKSRVTAVCGKYITITNIKGIVYYCSACSDKVPIDISGKSDAQIESENENAVTDQSPDDRHDAHGTPQVLPVPDPETETAQPQPEANRPRPPAENGRVKRICPHYRRNQCRFGRAGKGCSKRHPEPCQRLMKYGNFCDENLDGCWGAPTCPEFHPRICRSSMAERTCSKPDCTFRHLDDTTHSQPLVHDEPSRDRRPHSQASDTLPPQSNQLPPQRNEINHFLDERNFFDILEKQKGEIMDAMESKITLILSQMNRNLERTAPRPPPQQQLLQQQPSTSRFSQTNSIPNSHMSLQIPAVLPGHAWHAPLQNVPHHQYQHQQQNFAPSHPPFSTTPQPSGPLPQSSATHPNQLTTAGYPRFLS